MLAERLHNELLSPHALNVGIQRVGSHRDKATFAELFSYFAPRIKAFAMKRRFDEATAEEITQEVMRAIWEKAASFDPGKATANAWVFSIARNQCIDRFRKDVRHTENLDAYALELPPMVTHQPSLETARMEGRIQQAMAEMPTEQAEILQRAFFEGKSHQVISHECKLPLGTVKSRIRLALARLKGSL